MLVPPLSAGVAVFTSGAQHDHPVAKRELGVGDGVTLARHDQVPLEAEGAAEPLDGGGSVLISEAGNDGGSWVVHGHLQRWVRVEHTMPETAGSAAPRLYDVQ